MDAKQAKVTLNFDRIHTVCNSPAIFHRATVITVTVLADRLNHSRLATSVPGRPLMVGQFGNALGLAVATIGTNSGLRTLAKTRRSLCLVPFAPTMSFGQFNNHSFFHMIAVFLQLCDCNRCRAVNHVKQQFCQRFTGCHGHFSNIGKGNCAVIHLMAVPFAVTLQRNKHQILGVKGHLIETIFRSLLRSQTHRSSSVFGFLVHQLRFLTVIHAGNGRNAHLLRCILILI